MEVTYKNPTELASTQRRWGLAHEQLPGTAQRDISPESVIGEQIKTGRKQIWDRFTLQWDEINRSRQFIGAGKAQRMQQELHAKAKQDMLAFNQKTQMQMNQLRNIDQLVKIEGGLTEAQGAKVKIELAFGKAIADQIYPTPEKGQSVQQVMGELNRYKEIVQGNLDRYKSVRIPELWKSEAKEKRKTMFLDYSLPPKKEGEVGDWRDTTKKDIEIQSFWKQELEEIKKRETELVVIPGISHRIVQPGTTGGTFSDKIAKGVNDRKPAARQSPTRQQPMKQLSETVAKLILKEANGDKELAREMAKSRGYRL